VCFGFLGDRFETFDDSPDFPLVCFTEILLL
jgi:hypothetical protein